MSESLCGPVCGVKEVAFGRCLGHAGMDPQLQERSPQNNSDPPFCGIQSLDPEEGPYPVLAAFSASQTFST